MIDRHGRFQCGRPEDLGQRELDFGEPSDIGDNRRTMLQEKVEELEPDTSKTEAEIEAKDLQRKTGDLEVYKYYFKSIGSAKLVVFVVFVLLNVLSSSFSRKY